MRDKDWILYNNSFVELCEKYEDNITESLLLGVEPVGRIVVKLQPYDIHYQAKVVETSTGNKVCVKHTVILNKDIRETDTILNDQAFVNITAGTGVDEFLNKHFGKAAKELRK